MRRSRHRLTKRSLRRRRNRGRAVLLGVEVLERRDLLSVGHAVDPGLPFEHVEASGDVLCALPGIEAPTLAAGSPTAAPAAAPMPLEDTFLLHSDPGANHTIFLDFDGHVTSGTQWNTQENDGEDIETPAYDFNGDTSVFSNSELERIQKIWQRVAEDFFPFDVDVTTEDPGEADLKKTFGNDSKWGIRVVIGGTSDWFEEDIGGVAYMYSFTRNSDTPAFVFAKELGNGNEKYVAEAISHETGHTLGLHHDGRTSPSEEYYAGHGSGATGWAPIMGVGYYKELTQWSQGEYTGADETEDDLAIITGSNGFDYRDDDHRDINPLATDLTFDGTDLSSSGLIERNDDVDVFRFSTADGTLSLDVLPFERSPNLDILAELYDSGGDLIVSANPSDALDAALTTTVVAGEYYLHISGTGKGDPAGSGYSDYGSLGRYTIAGIFSPAAEVVERHVFYNNSQFDGNDPAAGALDDAAIATDKEALLPDETATFVNYTSYVAGINGIMIDVDGLIDTPTVDDFLFRIGNDDDPSGWEILGDDPGEPVPTVTVRPGEGAGEADRVTLIWPYGAVADTWLQVTVAANFVTGLLEPDVFYFGNAIGESGNSTEEAMVTSADEIAARHHPQIFTPADIDNPYDFNRDRRVTTVDQIIARHHISVLESLDLITIPPPAAPAPAAIDDTVSPTPQNSLFTDGAFYDFEQLLAESDGDHGADRRGQLLEYSL